MQATKRLLAHGEVCQLKNQGGTIMKRLIALLTIFVSACIASPETGPTPDAGSMVDAGPASPDAAPDTGEPEPERLPTLLLPFELCEGQWAGDDSSTRYTAHPDTGMCTFSCAWLDARCDEPWFGDPRCFPAHGQTLEALCQSLGGACELDVLATSTYCVFSE